MGVIVEIYILWYLPELRLNFLFPEAGSSDGFLSCYFEFLNNNLCFSSSPRPIWWILAQFIIIISSLRICQSLERAPSGTFFMTWPNCWPQFSGKGMFQAQKPIPNPRNLISGARKKVRHCGLGNCGCHLPLPLSRKSWSQERKQQIHRSRMREQRGCSLDPQWVSRPTATSPRPNCIWVSLWVHKAPLFLIIIFVYFKVKSLSLVWLFATPWTVT